MQVMNKRLRRENPTSYMNGVIIEDSEFAFSNKGMRATVPPEAVERDLMEASKNFETKL